MDVPIGICIILSNSFFILSILKSSLNFTSEINVARGIMSTPMLLKPRFLQVNNVVPTPQNGSRITDLLFKFDFLIKYSTISGEYPCL